MPEKEILTLQVLIFSFSGIFCVFFEGVSCVCDCWWICALLLLLHQIGFFMVAFLKNIRRRKRIKALAGSHIQVFPKVEELGSVAVIWRIDTPEEVLQLGEVMDFFSSLQLESTIVVVEHGKAFKNKLAREEFSQLCEQKGVFFIPKALLKWYGFPKGEAVKQLFLGKKYDMTICMCPVQDFTVEYLAAGMKSNFKTGMCLPQWCNFSFVLERGQAVPLAAEYLAALFEYMRKMSQE